MVSGEYGKKVIEEVEGCKVDAPISFFAFCFFILVNVCVLKIQLIQLSVG